MDWLTQFLMSRGVPQAAMARFPMQGQMPQQMPQQAQAPTPMPRPQPQGVPFTGQFPGAAASAAGAQFMPPGQTMGSVGGNMTQMRRPMNPQMPFAF